MQLTEVCHGRGLVHGARDEDLIYGFAMNLRIKPDGSIDKKAELRYETFSVGFGAVFEFAF